MGAEATQADGSIDLDTSDWAYVVDARGLTMQFKTRHDAVGFEALWPYDGDIQAVPHTSQTDPVTLLNTDT